MNLHRLDPADPEALSSYERAFYAAFARAKANTQVRRLWHWDDRACRLRTRIPYADQVVFLLRDGASDESGAGGRQDAAAAKPDAVSDVDTAVALNWRLADHQSAVLGFAPPPPLQGHCEILAMFSRRDADLSGLRNFMRTAAQQALELGLRTADATCTDRLLPAYRHIGGQPLDACSIEGERRTRLRFDLENLARLERLT